jgi:Ulp1 family protease
MIKIIEPNSNSLSVLDVLTPQQRNHYDCGLYVLANATFSSIQSLEKILNEDPILSFNAGSRMRAKILATVVEISKRIQE